MVTVACYNKVYYTGDMIKVTYKQDIPSKTGLFKSGLEQETCFEKVRSRT